MRKSDVVKLGAAVAINVDRSADALNDGEIKVAGENDLAAAGGNDRIAPGIENVRGAAVHGLTRLTAGVAGDDEHLVFDRTGRREGIPMILAQRGPLGGNEEHVQTGQRKGAHQLEEADVVADDDAALFAVKLEGGASVCEAVKAMTTAGIPVVGHIGLTPQSVHQLGGFRVQGKNSETAKQLIADALKLEEAGAFAITLECVPTDIATEITKALHTAATIGIGAGNGTDGQVLVCTDLLGMSNGFRPKFVKTYADLHQTIVDAVGQYIHDVKDRSFPDEAHGFAVDPEVVKAMKE